MDDILCYVQNNYVTFGCYISNIAAKRFMGDSVSLLCKKRGKYARLLHLIIYSHYTLFIYIEREI